MLGLFQQDPTVAVIVAGIILLSLTLHELGHAWAAEWSGDPTPRLQGRLSPNPLVHLDLFGTLLILLIGFGYARPVQTNPSRYRFRLGELFVSSAGVLVNLALAILALLALRFLNVSDPAVVTVLSLTAYFNVVLAVFNALPVPPLDGAHILAAILPRPLSDSLRRAMLSPIVLILPLLLIFALRAPLGNLILTVFQGLQTVVGLR
ncbi:Zn-dependent protease [Deinobacterium chartae]|uniref:Zn-dependent protease n=1 Tax=Deinobacterium chartae TaxID=521158 RepID=A0A841HWM9_9DEIO|nr:site-2 protease family protein [Deinobacterium chartae]MBB6097326.1 Zn-dependent protease [Deinobacterium chartae]